MEVEAKYVLKEPVTANQIVGLPWAPYRLSEHGSLDLHDVFWDSPDRKLSHVRHAVRSRNVGEHFIITLKGPGNVEDGVHIREEWERAATNATPDNWPDEILHRLRPFVEPHSLARLLSVKNRRHVWMIVENYQVIG